MSVLAGAPVWLACPRCRGTLLPAAGGWRCARCNVEYAVHDSVSEMLDFRSFDGATKRTRERFAWEWERYRGTIEEDRRVFLEETQISDAVWKGKLALDVGCGMGRYARVALALGAEVVAFDLSDSLFRLREIARDEPRLHLIQGDSLQPPFAPRRFDIVYSQGVLHHTPDTEKAFRSVAALVKPGGFLSVWVYGRPGRLADFKENPLKTDRQWLSRWRTLVWCTVWIRMILSDLLRVLTVKLPSPLLYALCFPLAAIGALPGFKYLTFSAHPDFRVRLHENFDWLAPPFQHKHTRRELVAWFESEGFEVLRILPHGVVPKIGVVGRKK